MKNPFLARLEQLSALGAEDQARLLAVMTGIRRIPARADILRQGERPGTVQILLEGFACRYKLVYGGQRAITAFLLPGDFSGLQDRFFEAADHGLAALTPCTIAEVARPVLESLMDEHPGLAQALWRLAMVDSAIERQWLANMGRLSSDRQLAHLFCELRLRLSLVGLADEDGFRLPLTQHELGDAMGISTVHVNRTLQHLRDLGLIRIVDRMLTIPHLDQLEAFCEFDPSYLHLDETGGHSPFTPAVGNMERAFEAASRSAAAPL